MKLSEAILLGSTVLAAKPGGQYFSETDAGCALGMAAIANGCSFRRVTGTVAERDRLISRSRAPETRDQAISPNPRDEDRQAEQEWQRLRQAFEARHKTRRSSPKIS